MTSRALAVVLALLTAGCAGMFGSEWSSATPDCPPRTATASTPSPTLSAAGRGQPAREVMTSDGSDFGARPTGTSRLVGTPMGTPVIVDSGTSAPLSDSSAPRFVAGGRGVQSRVDCDR